MKRRYLNILFILFLGMPVFAESYDAILQKIDNSIKSGDWVAAEKYLNIALKEQPANPNNCLLISNLGTVHRNMGQLSMALRDYDNALAIAPNATTILHNRASLLLEMDSLELAIEDFRRIVALSPQDAEAKYHVGLISMESGNMDYAKKCFDEILDSDKRNPDAKRGLALWCKLKGDVVRAIGLYSEILKGENRFSNYANRAECYLETGQLTEAQDDIMEAQKLDPSNPDVFLLKARLAQLQYRYDDMTDYARRAIALGCDKESAEPFLKKTKR